MTLDMLYSTFEDGIYSLIKNIPKKTQNVYIVIIHQVSLDFNDEKINLFLKSRDDISYYKSKTKGVAISRNIALEKAKHDIVLFCDDDVIYTNNFQQNIFEQYESNPDAKFITFAYSNTINMNELAPKFSSSKYRQNFKSILNVGTIEVTANRNTVINNNIKFPEDMGAGTKYFLCDEPVFLSQFLKKKIYGLYIPIIICFHPPISSGKIFNTENAFGSRYLCFTRIFGSIFGLSLYILYLMKNINKFKKPSDIKRALCVIFKVKR